MIASARPSASDDDGGRLEQDRQIQSERRNRDTDRLEAVSRLYVQAKRANQPFDPAALGFEFSISDIETYSGSGSVLEIGYAAFKRASNARSKMQTAA